MLILGVYSPLANDSLAGIESVVTTFSRDRVFTRLSLLPVDDALQGIRRGIEVIQATFFRPTVLFLTATPSRRGGGVDSIGGRERHGRGALAPHPDVDLAHETAINVWVRDQSPEWEVGLRLSNLDLSLLLAYQLHPQLGGPSR